MYYAFQYATTDGQIFKDECFLTKDQAYGMFEDHLPLFLDHMGKGLSPEMAVWEGMETDSDYHTMGKHYHADEFEVRGGQLYRVTAVPINIK